MLAQLHDWNCVVTIRCGLCRSKRHYLPIDLMAIFGDIEFDELERKMVCESCERKKYVDLRFWSPMPRDDYPMTVRRLERVQTIIRPIWRDEPRE